MALKSRYPIFYWIVLVAFVFFEGAQLQAQEVVKHYLVKLRDEPVIAHLRHQTAGPASLRLEMESADTAVYRAQLQTRQRDVQRRIEAFPGAVVRGQVDTVFNGFAVSLRPQDVASLKLDPDVEDVIPSIQYHKLLDAAIPLVNVPQAWANPKVGGEANAGRGVKVAIIDTGIDINHPMFQDTSLVPPTGFPRFTVSTASCKNTDRNFTNTKVIVAKNYVDLLDNPDQFCDAEDRDGHGTFVSAIAAGKRVTAPLASIAGVAPEAFLGSYKVFGTPGTNDTASLEAIITAIDDAVKDGMNVINLSLGAPANDLPANDQLAIAAANAVSAGVTVVAASGNEGPGSSTVTSPGTSPAVITVGAATNSRILANPLLITASTPVPPPLDKLGGLPRNGPKITSVVGPAPLVDVTTVGASDACSALQPGTLAGKFVLIRRGNCNFSDKILNAFTGGAAAVIIYNDRTNEPPIVMDVGAATQIPSVMIGNSEGIALVRFLASAGPGVQVSLQPQQVALATPPNQLADFSSNGPSTDFGIKPDLVAPGTTIYSAAQRNYPDGVQYDASGFTIFSGTSFSSPLVAGAAALVKQAAPSFTPAQIKSVLVNTAAKTVTSPQGGFESVLSQGNGLLNAGAALTSPITVSPASVSFGARPSGSVLITTTNLTVTNAGTASDTFSVTVTQTVGSLELSASPSGFTLAGGASTGVALTVNSTQPLNGTKEGFISIRGQNSQSTITVPYWVTFVQPSVNSSGVVNAASFVSGSFSVAPGSIVSIFGSDLANTTESAAIVPLPLSLGGSTVTIGGQAVPLLFASPTQINAQIPFELSGSSVSSLVVSLDGLSSPPVTVSLLPAAPGIFTVGQGGTGRGAILHASDSSAVTPNNPARAGEFLGMYSTGLGTTTPAVDTGAAASITPLSLTQITPTVTIGGVSAPVSFSGLAPSFVGLYQTNVQVPPGLLTGDQTLILTANGIASNPVTVSIGN